jgi:hypothetical protein
VKGSVSFQEQDETSRYNRADLTKNSTSGHPQTAAIGVMKTVLLYLMDMTG